MAMCVKKQMINVPAVKAVPDTNRCISLSLSSPHPFGLIYSVSASAFIVNVNLTSRKDNRKVKRPHCKTKTKQYYAALCAVVASNHRPLWKHFKLQMIV